jgi:hypothetical protein
MSEGRKPKLNWLELETIFYPDECSDVCVRTSFDNYLPLVGDWTPNPHDLQPRKTLEEAKLACEDWLQDHIRAYFPAARALGMLEAEE